MPRRKSVHGCRRRKKKLGSCFSEGNVETCEESLNYGAKIKILLCCVHLWRGCSLQVVSLGTESVNNIQTTNEPKQMISLCTKWSSESNKYPESAFLTTEWKCLLITWPDLSRCNSAFKPVFVILLLILNSKWGKDFWVTRIKWQ